MQFQEIDKALYRTRLNRIIVTFVATFALLAVSYGAILIHFFSLAPINDEPVNNFRFNVAGVVLALMSCAAILHRLRSHALFSEVYYVWQLKQLHNKIYRQLKSLKKRANEDDIEAFIILNFYYHTLKQVYRLDDNTLTISAVESDDNVLQEKIAARNLSVSLSQFSPDLLKKSTVNESL